MVEHSPKILASKEKATTTTTNPAEAVFKRGIVLEEGSIYQKMWRERFQE